VQNTAAPGSMSCSKLVVQPRSRNPFPDGGIIDPTALSISGQAIPLKSQQITSRPPRLWKEIVAITRRLRRAVFQMSKPHCSGKASGKTFTWLLREARDFQSRQEIWLPSSRNSMRDWKFAAGNCAGVRLMVQ
jgi:hypothetical protein